MFFQNVCEFVIHCNKIHIFLCLFFLLTITDRNEAIIIELKQFFVLNGIFIPFPGVPIIRFLAIKNNAAIFRR